MRCAGIALLLAVLLAAAGAAAQQREVTPQATTPPAEKRLALVIGNSAYKVGPLRNPVNDARAVAKVLKDTLGFEVLLHHDLNQKDMKRAVIDFGDRLSRQRGIGLFFYAGHGMQVGGRNYLVPVDAEINAEREVEVESVDVAYVLARMETAANNVNIVVLDACRDNPFARRFRTTARGLASIDAPAGTLIAYATAPGSVAADGVGAHSPYTNAFLDAIRRPGLKVEEVFKVVRQEVWTRTNQKQTPWEASSLVGEFYFVPKPIAAPEVDVYPVDNATIEREQERVTAIARDELGISKVEMTVNGRRIPLNVGKGASPGATARRLEVETDVPLTVGGNVVEIKAWNAVGKSTTVVRRLRRVEPAPIKANALLVILSPTDGVDIFVGEQRIGRTSPTDPLVKEVARPGRYAIRGTKPGFLGWERAVEIGPDQSHAPVVVDIRPIVRVEPARPGTPPRIQLSYPSEDARLERENIPVIALVTDEVGIARLRLIVNGEPIPDVKAPADQSGTVEIETPVPLQMGENVLTITVTNKSGKTAQVIRKVHRESPKMAAVTAAPKVPEKPEGERYAVVIGIGIYDNPQVPRLRFAENDARSVYNLLTTKGKYRKDNVLLITDTAPMKPFLANIKRGLGEWLFKKAGKDDTVFVYYAGYGGPEVNASGTDRDGLSKYLIPRDADPESLFVTAFAMDDVETIFRRLQSDRVVFVIDTCFSGAPGGRTLTRQMTRSGHMSREFLDRLAGTKGRVVISAAGPNETCLELPQLKHGLFTYHIMKGLDGAADGDGDKIVTVNELFQYVQKHVSDDARQHGAKQTPVMSGAAPSLPLIEIKELAPSRRRSGF